MTKNEVSQVLNNTMLKLNVLHQSAKMALENEDELYMFACGAETVLKEAIDTLTALDDIPGQRLIAVPD